MKTIKPCLLRSLLFILLPALLLSCTRGPEPVAEKVFATYEGQPGVLSFYIPPGMVNLAVSGSADEELKDFLSRMESIKVLLIGDEKNHQRDYTKLYKDTGKSLDKLGFEDLVEINNEGNKVLIKVHDEGDKTNEAVVLIKGDDGFVALAMRGDIDIKQLAKMAYDFHAGDFRKGE